MAFKKLTAGLMASSMILGLAAQASAEITTATAFDVATKMNKLGIVIGNGTLPGGEIDFNLGGNLTRAELVTTIVRSFGAEQAAQLAKGAPSFADVHAGDWFSGYVAVAKNLAEQAGTSIGRDANTFDPNANVSKAEALVFVMKFLGIKVNSTGDNWYEAWIAKAVELGMISADDAAIALANPGGAALRGEAFIILDFGYSAKVLEGGKSLYTAFVKSTPPVVEVAAPAESTADAKITISGRVSDSKGVASVAVNGHAVEFKDGNFAAEVELHMGANPVVVTATDIAGNTASKTFTVSRVNAAAAGLEAADITVAAGAEAHVAAKLVDANGAEITGAEITGASTVGTYDNGKFTAGTKAGTGTLTLAHGELTKEVKVTVTAGELAKVAAPSSVKPGSVAALSATDAHGNAISGATFAVTGSDKAFVDPAGNFYASAAGSYTVVATAGGHSVESTVAVYGDIAKFLVEADAEMVGNNWDENGTEYVVTVKAADEKGTFLPYDEAGVADMVTLTVAGDEYEAEMKAGVATFKITISDALVGEEIELVATASFADGDIDVDGKTTAKVVGQEATGISVKPDSKWLVSNTTGSVDVAVNVVDQKGVKMADGEWKVTVALSGPATFTDGTASKTIDWSTFSGKLAVRPSEVGVEGAVTISATAEGLTAGNGKMTAAVAQVAKQIVLTDKNDGETTVEADDEWDDENALSYSVSRTDKNGVPVAAAPTNYLIKIDGIAKADFDAAGDAEVFVSTDGGAHYIAYHEDGLHGVAPTGSFSFLVKGTKAGDYQVSIEQDEDKPTLTASTKASFKVIAEQAAAEVQLDSKNNSVVALRGQTTTFLYQIYDQYGNKLSKKDVVVFVTETDTDSAFKVNGEASPKAAGYKTDANGQIKIEVVGSVLNAKADYQASLTAVPAEADPMTSVEITSTIAKTVTAKVEYEKAEDEWVAYTGSLEVGQKIRLIVDVKDQDGYALGDYAEHLEAKALNDAFKKEGIEFHDGEKLGTYISDEITVTTAGSSTFEVQVNNQNTEVKGTSRSVAFRAGDLASLAVGKLVNLDAGTYELTVTADKLQEVTVNLADIFGNTVLASKVSKEVKISFDKDGFTGSYLSFRDADGNELIGSGLKIAANRTSAKFFLVTSKGAAGDYFEVTATIGDEELATIKVFIK